MTLGSGRSKAKACTDSGTGDIQVDLVQLPATCDRVNGRKYLHKGNMCMWKNGIICCEHGRRKSSCKECGGSAICEHGRLKRQCKECGGSGICEHGRSIAARSVVGLDYDLQRQREREK